MSELNQCPCEPACKCLMDDPCKGCETYGEWLSSQSATPLVEALEEICGTTCVDGYGKVIEIADAALGEYKGKR